MRKKNFLLLAGATIVAVALAIAAVGTGGREVATPAAGAPAFPGLAKQLGNVAVVKIEGDGVKATFRRAGEDWRLLDKSGYPANAGRLRQIVLALAELKLVEPKTRDPKLYSRLEVEDPGKGKSHLLTIEDKTGKPLAAMIVGKQRYDRLGTGQNGVYVRRPGTVQSWLAAGSRDLSGNLPGWLDRHILDIPQARIAAASLTAADGTKLVVKRAKPGDKFAVADLPADAKLRSENAAGQPASLLEALDLEDVMPAAKLPVPETGVTSASLQTFDGLTITLRLFSHGKEDWVAVSASGAGKAAAEAKRINDKVSRWAYAIPPYKASLLRLKLADLLAPPPKS